MKRKPTEEEREITDSAPYMIWRMTFAVCNTVYCMAAASAGLVVLGLSLAFHQSGGMYFGASVFLLGMALYVWSFQVEYKNSRKKRWGIPVEVE